MSEFQKRIQWDEFDAKESHPGKKLSKHIKEVNMLFKRFSNFYEIDPRTKKVMELIIKYHDYGKLNHAWDWKDKIRPTHADFSLRYLEENGLTGKLESEVGRFYYPLVWYLILKHHTALSETTSFTYDHLQELCSTLTRERMKKMSLRDRIRLIDAFGLFKLADSLSASNNSDFRPKRPPRQTLRIVKNMLARNGRLDESRWMEQRELMRLGNTSILTAYTGWGKTDASLLFFHQRDVRKIFYIFPTTTAINKFYRKLDKSLPGIVDKYFYMYEYELAANFDESRDEINDQSSSIFNASHFLKPIILTTADQLLLNFLQVGKYYSKRVAFRGGGLVFDEVHLLNPKMLALLLRFLRTFGDIYKLRTLFMSATLSEARAKIIKKRLHGVETMDRSKGYENLCRIKYDLDVTQTLFDMVGAIIKNFRAGRKVLVVLNTVEPAVRLAGKLREELMDDEPLILLHSRFMYKDRMEKEDQIDRLHAKGIPHILVSTQVCEVSLDVSYDVLFTELAPVPAIIQRFGRVNRYEKTTKKTNARVLKEVMDSSKYPYERQDLGDALKVLDELHPLQNERQLITKFNEVEDYDKLAERFETAENETDFEAAWANDSDQTGYFFSFDVKADEAYRKLLQFRDELNVNVLPAPTSIETGRTHDELAGLLTKDWTSLNRDQRNHCHRMLRGYFVPVPIWWLKGLGQDVADAHGGFRPIEFADKEYTNDFGFLRRDNVC